MKIGDVVVRRSYDKDISFKVIDIEHKDGKEIYVLKGINIRIIADSEEMDLELVEESYEAEKDKILNARVTKAIDNALLMRDKRIKKKIDNKKKSRSEKVSDKKHELTFGRPGKILHIDGDNNYLETCLKVYRQLSLDAVGKSVIEHKQPKVIVDLVKEVKPDIVVLTGHDSVLRNTEDFLDVNNYRNSKYYIEAVRALRNYNSSYDELIIFAGACQSCYEALLDAGANFASAPNRVLIHCLDPVFVCEKIAYTKIDEIINIKDVIDNTITGCKGIGGMQSRGKYREGYPKSYYM